MTKVAFLVNGGPDSAMAQRARAFSERLANRYEIRTAFRSRHKLFSILRFSNFLFRNRPSVAYVFDMAYSGVLAGVFYKVVTRRRLIIDTGDCISALASSMGRGPAGVWLTALLENISFWAADRIVVRGSFHLDLLRKRGIAAELVRDGVDCVQFAPGDSGDLRRQYRLEGSLTVGVVGTPIWNPRLQTCYGRELVEVLRLLKNHPVKGILIGDGSGLPHLKSLSREYEVEEQMLFMGFIPYDRLPLYLSMIDVCVSTQTNDIVGNVRTTGKLPLYLASGRHILATRAGEASLVLDESMLVEYEGISDPAYAGRLVDRIRPLLRATVPLAPSMENMKLAREQFDYSVLSSRLESIIAQTLQYDHSSGTKEGK
jgi:hypothetical protein